MRPVPTLGVLTLAVASAALPLSAQEIPLPTQTGAGRSVTPAYEGWYEKADGTIGMSFGYMNRNTEEVIEIPIGENNSISDGFGGFQPTRFDPGRHFGVFTIDVPADFDPEKRVYWTLKLRGGTYSVPGHLHRDWLIDAIVGEAGSGNKPPSLKFSEDAEMVMGPGGPIGGPYEASAGQPLDVTVWAADDGRSVASVRGVASPQPVELTWFKHQGPGDVEFSEPTARVPWEGGSATTSVMFSAPGEYVLRVRANDASGVSAAGHAQCCWSNGFVRVTVTP